MTSISGMGAIPHQNGTAFRVWAPHASSVHVIGTFNQFDATANPMQREDQGYWYADVPNASIGDEYRFYICNGEQSFSRIDPYTRQVTNSVGNGVIYDPAFDWGDNHFQMPDWNKLVIYELHVGTFNRSKDNTPGTFADLTRRLGHLQRLGVNAIQLMPCAEFAGDISWGYNPSHIFAIESAYGGPLGFKNFVKQAHAHGFAIIMDVVYNHFGPSDLDMWRFDGWSENGKGGIYFYNDYRSVTPWGDTRPDYGRGEVRQFICDNALMWIDEYHVNGLRYDMTLYIRSVDHSAASEIPEGWGLMQWLNRIIHDKFPTTITIAEDLQNNEYLCKPESEGGANFAAQWDAGFVHPVRNVLSVTNDHDRSMVKIVQAISHCYNGSAFQRVVYTESHDEVANGKARVPEEISADDPENWFAQKRSTLGAAIVMTSPGIPMLFQGQEFLQGRWFMDTEELDWDNRETFHGIVWLYADLIHLRLNRSGHSQGLTGQHFHASHINDQEKLIAFRRWDQGGPGDDVMVAANFANREWQDYRIGFPQPGIWKLRFNSDWNGYSDSFHSYPSHDITTDDIPYDGFAHSASIKIAPYTVLIFSQSVPQ